MRFLWTLIPLLLGVSTSSFADRWYPSPSVTQSAQIDLQPLRCPTVGKDYSQMISELHALQDKIKNDANCGKLVENLESIGQLSGDRRTKFLETIAKINKGETVQDKVMENMVIKYAEDVTVAAGSLATLLAQSDQCFGKQDLSTSLFTLSAFVNEASTMLSTVAGPWGPVLAVGGKVVAGFLSGVDRFIKSLPGYDFKDKKDWQGYVETLCTFHEQQDEVYALIHPDAAINDLSKLNAKLETQLKSVLNSTPQAEELYSSFKARDNEGLERLTQQINEASNSLNGLKAVRLMTAQKWILDRIASIELEANDPLAPGQYLVQKQRDEIEDFLIARQGPKFIGFQVKESRRALNELEDLVFYQGFPLYHQIKSLTEKPEDAPPIFIHPEPSEVLKMLVQVDENQFYGKGVQESQIYSSLVYFKRELGKKWDAVSIAYGVKASFCTFFERAGYYSHNIHYACTSRSAETVEKNMQEYVELGLNHVTPPYLRRAAQAAGLTWTESLDAWLTHLD